MDSSSCRSITKASRIPCSGTDSGPPVLVLHELSGLTIPTLDLARRLADNGFNGVPTGFLWPTGTCHCDRHCGPVVLSRREFELLALDRSGPIADWVRALCRQVAPDDASAVGVIGMCLTGNLALATMVEPIVGAVVSSQPSLPPAFPPTRRRRANLGLSPEEIAQPQDGGTPLIALRFRRDLASPAARAGDRCTFGSNATVVEVPAQCSYASVDPPIRRFAHAVLTFDLVDHEGHPTRAALDAVLGFLRRNLMSAEDDDTT